MSRKSAFLHQMMQCAARFSYGAGFQECGGRLAGQTIKGKLAEELNKSHQFVRTEGTVSVFGAWNGGLVRGKDGVESKAVLLHQGSYSSQMMPVVCGRAALVVEANLNGDIERRADWLGDMVVKPEHVRCASLPAIVPQWPTSAWKAVAVTQVRTAAIAWGFGSTPALSNRIMGASVLDANHIRAQTRSLAYGKMANRSIRDQNKRRLVEKYEMKRAHYKAVFHDRSLPSQVRYDFFQRLSKLPRSSSKTRLKNRCVFTGRSHSVFRKFGISRIVFRELARRGDLTGVYKASW